MQTWKPIWHCNSHSYLLQKPGAKGYANLRLTHLPRLHKLEYGQAWGSSFFTFCVATGHLLLVKAPQRKFWRFKVGFFSYLLHTGPSLIGIFKINRARNITQRIKEMIIGNWRSFLSCSSAIFSSPSVYCFWSESRKRIHICWGLPRAYFSLSQTLSIWSWYLSSLFYGWGTRL